MMNSSKPSTYRSIAGLVAEPAASVQTTRRDVTPEELEQVVGGYAGRCTTYDQTFDENGRPWGADCDVEQTLPPFGSE
jgi:hypothetical protein